MMEKLRGIHEVLSEEEISGFLSETYPDMNQPIEFEPFLKVHGIIFFCVCVWSYVRYQFTIAFMLAKKVLVFSNAAS